MLTQQRLKELFRYDPETGLFTRLASSGRSKAGDIVGHTSKEGYVRISIGGKSHGAHRLAFLYMTGDFPPFQTDHIDGVTGNNIWSNLRAVSRSENMKNKCRQKNNTSGFIGVTWSKCSEKWASQIQVNGRNKHLGLFDNISMAVEARVNGEHKYGFHKNHGRL